jgi:hypothetical protein
MISGDESPTITGPKVSCFGAFRSSASGSIDAAAKMPPSKSDNDAERRARLDQRLAQLRSDYDRRVGVIARMPRQAKAPIRDPRAELTRKKRT